MFIVKHRRCHEEHAFFSQVMPQKAFAMVACPVTAHFTSVQTTTAAAAATSAADAAPAVVDMAALAVYRHGHDKISWT